MHAPPLSNSSSTSSSMSNNSNSLPCSCIHLAGSITDSIRTRYALAVRWAKTRNEANDQRQSPKRTKYTAANCGTCKAPTSRPLICLTCGEVCCRNQGHLERHMKISGHEFGVEPRQGMVICSKCNDYVFSAELNNIYLDIQAHNHQHNGKYNSDLSKVVNNGVTCPQPRGIRNLGATCFMSVILQSFLHNPLLYSYYLSDLHNSRSCPHTQANPNNKNPAKCLSCETDKLFSEFYNPYSIGIFGPTTFLGAVWASSSELAGYAQQDAHEFLISAMNHIHAATHPQTLDPTHCDCIVHTTFCGLLKSEVKCITCGKTTSAIDPNLDLSLDLRRVKQEKLTDCLQRFTSKEKLGVNCSNCKGELRQATKQLKIKRLPPVLNIQLKRFEHSASSQKIDTKVEFSTVIDMRPYTHDSLQKIHPESYFIYDLFAVVNHEGQLNTGHYTNYARYKDEWWHFNDDKIRMCSLNEVISTNPYLLFYVKRSMLSKSKDFAPI